jgi:hypothetical protein
LRAQSPVPLRGEKANYSNSNSTKQTRHRNTIKINKREATPIIIEKTMVKIM